MTLPFSRFLAFMDGFRLWAKIHRNPWKNPSELVKLQKKMFRSVLKHAYENTVFYHRLYREHGIRPDNVKSLEDIGELPLVTKKDLMNCAIEGRFSRRFDIGRCSKSSTSGSTGEPFKVYLEPRARSYLGALHLRRLFIYGYRPGYTIVRFGPFWASSVSRIKKRGVRPGLLNLMSGLDANHLSLLDDVHENVAYLRAIKPEVIWSPPSYMRLLAQAMSKLGVEDVRPRIIICGAEMLDRPTRSLIEGTFGVKVFDEYGTVDVASRAIAWQCDRHDGYHINMDAVYLEFVKEGEHVSAGEEGYIVATNLFRYATPMIRYVIGDVGIPSTERCSCGRTFPLMKSIVGRSDDFLTLSNGRLVSPFSAMRLVSDIPGIRRYKIVQESREEIVVFIETGSEGTDIEENIRSNCSRFFGEEMRIEIVLGSITTVRGKKQRVVTSKVPVPTT